MLNSTRMHSRADGRRRPGIRSIGAIATGGLILGLAACGSTDGSTGAAAGSGTLDVVVHDSFHLADADRLAFEEESGLTLKIITTGDGGALANKLVLTKDAPLGDVTYGIDNSFASRAVAAGVFDPYTPADLPSSAADLLVDDAGSLTPIDYGDVCLNVDTEWFADHATPVPTTLEQLTEPAYRDLTVVTNPATSSPGLAFLFATVGHFGADGYLDYWQELRDNGLKVDEGWEDAYYTDFSAAGEGNRPIAIAYASSPAYTVSADGTTTSTAAMLSTCFRQVEYAGVLANGDNPEGAKKFIDFLLSERFQSSIPEAMFVYPMTPEVAIPADWAAFAPVPDAPIALDPKEIAANRDTWIKDWTAAVVG